MRKMKINAALFLLICFVLSACGNRNIFFEYQPIPPEGWCMYSVRSFDIDIKNIEKTYNVYINVRHRPNYPFQNLWLFITETAPNGIVSRDTIEIFLADHRGRWLGSGSGSVREMRVRIKQDFYFPEAGTYRFDIQQGMRSEVLQGITEIGMQVN